MATASLQATTSSRTCITTGMRQSRPVRSVSRSIRLRKATAVHLGTTLRRRRGAPGVHPPTVMPLLAVTGQTPMTVRIHPKIIILLQRRHGLRLPPTSHAILDTNSGLRTNLVAVDRSTTGNHTTGNGKTSVGNEMTRETLDGMQDLAQRRTEHPRRFDSGQTDEETNGSGIPSRTVRGSPRHRGNPVSGAVATPIPAVANAIKTGGATTVPLIVPVLILKRRRPRKRKIVLATSYSRTAGEM